MQSVRAYLIGRHGAQVLAIHPRQLGLVKDGRALCDAVQGKLLLEVIKSVDFLRWCSVASCHVMCKHIWVMHIAQKGQ